MSVAVVLLFLSLALLIFFADHLAHSIQVDSIMRVVERSTLPVIDSHVFTSEDPAPGVPAGAAAVSARRRRRARRPDRWAAIEEQARLLLADAAECVRRPDDLVPVHAEADAVGRALAGRRAAQPS